MMLWSGTAECFVLHRGSAFTAFFFGVLLIVLKHLIGRETKEAGRGEREETEDATHLQRSQK